MIQPSPTTRIDPVIARGVLERIQPPSPTHPRAHVVLSFPNSSYQTSLVLDGDAAAIASRVGKRVLGRITLSARRVDIVETGGRYLEPVFGRPRRVQGAVIATQESRGIPGDLGTIVVDAGGVPVHCRLTDSRQSASDFAIGTLVSFDAMDDATFTPES